MGLKEVFASPILMIRLINLRNRYSNQSHLLKVNVATQDTIAYFPNNVWQLGKQIGVPLPLL